MTDHLLQQATVLDRPVVVDEPRTVRPDGASPRGRGPRPSLLSRLGRRIIRRPSNWLNAPWPTERIVQYLTALVLVGGSTFAVLQVVHLDLVFTNNTPTGGDMGAHVMAPLYLRDHLLPHFELSGWSNYWYAGFPLYRFYMVIPALMIVGLNALWIPTAWRSRSWRSSGSSPCRSAAGRSAVSPASATRCRS